MLSKFFIILIASIIKFVRPLQSIDQIGKMYSGRELENIPYYIEILSKDGSHKCSGALVELRHAVAPSSCFYSRDRNVYSKLVCKPDGQRQIRRISKGFAHPFLLTKEAFQYNIGVVKVETPFTATVDVKPIRMKTISASEGEECIVCGKIFIKNDVITHSFVTVANSFQCNIESSPYSTCLTWNASEMECPNDPGISLICHGYLQAIFVEGDLFCHRNVQIFLNIATHWEWIDAIIRMKEYEAPNSERLVEGFHHKCNSNIISNHFVWIIVVSAFLL
ncbi:azurocidin-like isoform X2 [Hermetia illucens]|uniref:azurocidin-like isoform X2 n=1 Tax=Hermetia illucens TaxID=343691 RepID=UPI0018CC51F2|nr:azurocidin-like isoform X2 [Hermetia illucens]